MRRGAVLAAKVALTALLLAVVLGVIPVRSVLEALRGASPALFGAGFLVWLVSVLASATRLRCLTDLQGMSLSVRTHFAIHLSASFYGLFLPGVVAGSVLRWHRMYAPERNAAGALVVVLLNRVIATTATAGTGVVLWWLSGSRGGGHAAAGLAVLGVFVALAALQAALLHPRAAAAASGFVGSAGWIPAPAREGFRRTVVAIRQYAGMPRGALLRIAALSLVEEALGIVAFVLLGRAVGIGAAPTALGWARSFATIATILPVTVAGLGVREGSLVAVLAPFGVPGGEAVALSALLLARSVLAGLAGGIVEARGLFRRRGMVSSGGRR